MPRITGFLIYAQPETEHHCARTPSKNSHSLLGPAPVTCPPLVNPCGQGDGICSFTYSPSRTAPVGKKGWDPPPQSHRDPQMEAGRTFWGGGRLRPLPCSPCGLGLLGWPRLYLLSPSVLHSCYRLCTLSSSALRRNGREGSLLSGLCLQSRLDDHPFSPPLSRRRSSLLCHFSASISPRFRLPISHPTACFTE